MPRCVGGQRCWPPAVGRCWPAVFRSMLAWCFFRWLFLAIFPLPFRFVQRRWWSCKEVEQPCYWVACKYCDVMDVRRRVVYWVGLCTEAMLASRMGVSVVGWPVILVRPMVLCKVRFVSAVCALWMAGEWNGFACDWLYLVMIWLP